MVDLFLWKEVKKKPNQTYQCVKQNIYIENVYMKTVNIYDQVIHMLMTRKVNLLYILICVYMCVCLCVWECVCVFVCLCVCLFVCVICYYTFVCLPIQHLCLFCVLMYEHWWYLMNIDILYEQWFICKNIDFSLYGHWKKIVTMITRTQCYSLDYNKPLIPIRNK